MNGVLEGGEKLLIINYLLLRVKFFCPQYRRLNFLFSNFKYTEKSVSRIKQPLTMVSLI